MYVVCRSIELEICHLVWLVVAGDRFKSLVI
jgi:hypothetical protein